MDPLALALALPFVLLVGMMTFRMHRQDRDDERSLTERLQALRDELPALPVPAAPAPELPGYLPPPERASRGVFGRRVPQAHAAKLDTRHIVNRFNGRQRA